MYARRLWGSYTYGSRLNLLGFPVPHKRPTEWESVPVLALLHTDDPAPIHPLKSDLNPFLIDNLKVQLRLGSVLETKFVGSF